MSQPEPSSIPSGYPAERLLAAIVDSSEDAIVSKDLNGVVTSWNKGAERVFGYTAGEMVGQPIIKLMPPDRVNEEPGILARLRRGERVEHFETVRVRKDGRLIDVSLTISPVRDIDGTIVGASKIARDISDQKVAASKLTQAHEAVLRADRMKSEFISTLSHELRTPLNAINGWLQILRDGANEEELSQGLEVIQRNVRAQTQLVDDLLDMSRIESGKLRLDIQSVDVNAVIASALDAMAPTAGTRDIRITTALADVHSHQLRSLHFSSQGVTLGGAIQPALGHNYPDGVLMTESSAPVEPSPAYLFRLYLAGSAPNSIMALSSSVRCALCWFPLCSTCTGASSPRSLGSALTQGSARCLSIRLMRCGFLIASAAHVD